MGWGIPETETPIRSWGEYIEAAEKHYGYSELSNVRYMKNNLRENDLVWTRDTDGLYYLARVLSPWEYLANEESIRADIVNFFRSEIHRLDVDEVPGKVVACFRPPKTIQAIRDHTVSAYSKLLWNHHSGSQHYPTEDWTITDIYAFLDDKTTEDAVAIFLQMKGWLMLPESRKADTMSYEYILIHRESKERAVVQVKTGDTELNRDEWSGIASRLRGSGGVARAILFQSYGEYTGSEHRNVDCIDPEDLRVFLIRNRNILPRSIGHWVDFVLANNESRQAQ